MRGFLSWVTLDDAFTTQHGSPLKNADAFVAKQKDDPLVTPSVGVQGVYVASEETYAKAKEIADRRDVRLHTHLSVTLDLAARGLASGPWSGSRRSGSSENASPPRTALGSR